jgi:hypothetical protein
MSVVGRIAEIWRYPVQSMRGERLEAADVAAAGMIGDRAYGLVDAESGQVVSSAEGKRKWRPIVTLAARYAPAGDRVEILLPDGRRLTSRQTDIDARLGEAIGAPVHLADKAAEGVETAYAQSALHLLTTASLREFAAHHPEGRFAPARFRPNLVLDLGAETGFVEQGWIDRRFRLGADVVVRISEHCKRCIMTTLAQGDLPLDPGILHTVAQVNHARAGVYAAVLTAGRIAIGDTVQALD